jgi:ADP-heptose:LPS heptosyltransferase
VFPEVRRVLIYRLGSLGDTMVVLPCLHLVARLYPNAERRMLTNEPVHGKAPASSAIIGESGLVSSYITYAVGSRSPLELGRIVLKIRAFRPQVAIYLTKPRGEHVLARDQKFFRLCGVRKLIGLPTGPLGVNRPLGNGMWESEAARLARSLSELASLDVNELANWDLRLTEAERAAAVRALAPLAGRKLLCCGPGTKMQAKDWEMPRWRALLDRLAAAFPEHGLVLVGAKDDHAVSEEASCAWEGRRANLCGALKPRETAALMPRMELFLGPDSGPMHFAASAGVPCAIAFASRTRPGIWFPAGRGHQVVYHELACSNCDLEHCTENQKRCLTSISVDEMFEAALAAWKYGRQAAGIGV